MALHPRAKRLKVLHSLAEREQDARLRAWGELQQKLKAELEQRTLLESYQQEYQRQISQPTSMAISAGLVHGTLGFMTQIEQALTAQQEKLTLLKRQTEQARQAFLEQQSKTQALVKLMDKLDQEYLLEQEKQLQKQTDELVNRAASLRMSQRSSR